MDTFRWLAIVLSTVLGLGIARILSGYVSVFKLRRSVPVRWLPLVLAGVILFEFIQFWWGLAELLNRPTWDVPDFLVLVALVMLLFASAALISPTDADLADGGDVFERDGRFALVLLAGFHAMASVANMLFWGQPPWAPAALSVPALAGVSLAAAFVTRARVQQGLTVLYVAISLGSMWIISPASY